MKTRYLWMGLAALMVATSAAAQGGSQKKIQCWTDKNGQRMCGDRVPPEYAGQKRDVIKDGRVVDTVRAAKTPEEAAEEARKKKEADEARKRADYDRALLESYRSAKDIEVMRDERVALIDGRLKSAEKNAADTDKGLEGLRARAEALTKENKPVDERLAKQIKEFERAQKQNHKALERYRKEREDLVQKFNHDLARYNELRPPAAPAAPAQPNKDGRPAAPAQAQKSGAD